jgi:hypothetical protein
MSGCCSRFVLVPLHRLLIDLFDPPISIASPLETLGPRVTARRRVCGTCADEPPLSAARPFRSSPRNYGVYKYFLIFFELTFERVTTAEPVP